MYILLKTNIYHIFFSIARALMLRFAIAKLWSNSFWNDLCYGIKLWEKKWEKQVNQKLADTVPCIKLK